jgi:hypothetical protein
MKQEKTALSCLLCSYGEIINTPESQSDLLKVINRLKLCPQCDKPSICQTAWSDGHGAIRSVQF